ncbi:MAG: hypothetical protein IPK52_27490 [Chloroflexi bacterium]|nr:hypothetical protein [Chloroflexota bacterium]
MAEAVAGARVEAERWMPVAVFMSCRIRTWAVQPVAALDEDRRITECGFAVWQRECDDCGETLGLLFYC